MVNYGKNQSLGGRKYGFGEKSRQISREYNHSSEPTDFYIQRTSQTYSALSWVNIRDFPPDPGAGSRPRSGI